MPKRRNRVQAARRKGARGANNPMGERVETKSWNVLAEQTPALTRVQRLDNKAYRFCQTVDTGPILTSSAGAATFYGTAFNIAALPQVSSLANLFDQYRIDEIEAWIVPSNGVTNDANQKLYSVVDYDSSSTPGSITQLLGYQNVMETNCTNGHYRRWRPHVGTALGIPNTTVQGMGNIKSPWIDMLIQGVNHNGLLIGMSATSTTCVLSLRVRYTVSVRNVF